MRVSFSPQRRDDALTVTKTGDILTINGEGFDFSGLLDGATIPEGEVPCEWISGPVERIGGELRLTLRLPHGANPEVWQAFPEPILNPPDGPLDVPTNTVVEVERVRVEGGVNVITTTRRWNRPPEVVTVFVPDPPPASTPAPEEEEPADANMDG